MQTVFKGRDGSPNRPTGGQLLTDHKHLMRRLKATECGRFGETSLPMRITQSLFFLRGSLRRIRFQGWVAVSSCFLLSLVSLGAQSNPPALPEELKPLTQRSPFVPEGMSEQPVQKVAPPPARKLPPIEAELEYRGHYNWEGALRVSLFVRKENRSRWVHVGENFGDYTLVSVNLKEPSLSIRREGRIEQLALKKPSNTPVPIPSNQVQPPTPANQPPLPNGIIPQVQNAEDARPGPPPRRRRIIVPTTQAQQ